MSVTKNKDTRYHDAPQDVKFKLSWLRIDRIDAPQTVTVAGGLVGRVGTAEGEVDKKEASFSREELNDEFTVAEKQAARVFAAACERVLALKVSELSEEQHDDTDVFV